MRIGRVLLLLTVLFFSFAACQKEISDEDDTGGGGGGGGSQDKGMLVRMQQGIDPDIMNDTVRLFRYNAAGKISTIVDSLNEDSVLCNYDPSGRLIALISTYGEDAFYTYDAAGLLTQIDYDLAGSRERYVFSYNNGVIAKKEYFSDLGSGGPYSLRGYATYSVSNGNISNLKEYNHTGGLIAETNFSYSSTLNPFKELSLFNNYNSMGTLRVINYETYFNKNLLTAAMSDGKRVDNVYTFDNKQRVTKLVSSDGFWNAVYTWQFTYK